MRAECYRDLKQEELQNFAVEVVKHAMEKGKPFYKGLLATNSNIVKITVEVEHISTAKLMGAEYTFISVDEAPL